MSQSRSGVSRDCVIVSLGSSNFGSAVRALPASNPRHLPERIGPCNLRTDRHRREGIRVSQTHPRGLCTRPRSGHARTGGFGAPGRIRTCDLRLRRPTLYPLSYGRTTQPRALPQSGGNDNPAQPHARDSSTARWTGRLRPRCRDAAMPPAAWPTAPRRHQPFGKCCPRAGAGVGGSGWTLRRSPGGRLRRRRSPTAPGSEHLNRAAAVPSPRQLWAAASGPWSRR